MLRTAKPKLSLSISTAAQSSSRGPSLSLSTSSAMPRTPISPSPLSPTAFNTRMNKRGLATLQQPSYAYANSAAASKSILKKGAAAKVSGRNKRAQFSGEGPTVYCVTPVENKEDYWVKGASREERRWGRS